jgi:hypothetical protein
MDSVDHIINNKTVDIDLTNKFANPNFNYNNNNNDDLILKNIINPIKTQLFSSSSSKNILFSLNNPYLQSFSKNIQNPSPIYNNSLLRFKSFNPNLFSHSNPFY